MAAKLNNTNQPVKSFLDKRWLVIFMALSLAVCAIAIVSILNPTETNLLPSCVFHNVTGLHCPGCGSTRALHALVHWELYAAFRLNPMLFTGVPVIVALALVQRRIRNSNRKLNYVISIVITAIVLGYFAARNIPTPSSSPLRPIDYRSDSPLLN